MKSTPETPATSKDDSAGPSAPREEGPRFDGRGGAEALPAPTDRSSQDHWHISEKYLGVRVGCKRRDGVVSRRCLAVCHDEAGKERRQVLWDVKTMLYRDALHEARRIRAQWDEKRRAPRMLTVGEAVASFCNRAALAP